MSSFLFQVGYDMAKEAANRAFANAGKISIFFNQN